MHLYQGINLIEKIINLKSFKAIKNICILKETQWTVKKIYQNFSLSFIDAY